MSTLSKKMFFLLLLVLCMIGWIQLAWAQSGGVYKISKSTIDAGGGVAQGGIYKISGTIGQADAASEISGGIFSLTDGYWTTIDCSDCIFKDGFEGL